MFATCETPGCGNMAAPIPIPAEAVTVICGVCGNPITDLTTTPPEPVTEVPEWLL